MGFARRVGYFRLEGIIRSADEGGEASMERFFVRAGSVNAVRRALGRAPGGARVVGRFDRETIECSHTMADHSHQRHWPEIVSRLEKAGLNVVERPGPPRRVDVVHVKTPTRE